jgi:hypothetical protein
MSKKYIKYKGKKWYYSDDLSWKKFMNILNEYEYDKIIEWYYDNVLLEPKPKDFKIVLIIIANLRVKFKHTDKQIKQLLRESGKIVRGIPVIEHERKAIMFNLIYDLKMDYFTILKMPWEDIIFFNGMVQEIRRLEKEANERAKRNAKNK